MTLVLTPFSFVFTTYLFFFFFSFCILEGRHVRDPRRRPEDTPGPGHNVSSSRRLSPVLRPVRG